MRLTLYKDRGVWMFDDAAHGIEREPFVDGSTELIDFILEEFGFPTKGQPVVVEFGLKRTHPDMVEIRKVEDTGDDWAIYQYKDCQGALCPVTLVYLGSHPDRFYARPVRGAGRANASTLL
jgi:hypothetical protein